MVASVGVDGLGFWASVVKALLGWREHVPAGATLWHGTCSPVAIPTGRMLSCPGGCVLQLSKAYKAVVAATAGEALEESKPMVEPGN